MTDKPFASYAERNAQPILDVLESELADARTVLEIGSGTGQHAVRFSAALRHLIWQTSDLDENHDGIRAWIEDAACERLLAPLSLDVRTTVLPHATYDAVFSANTAHIMSFDAVVKMFALVGRVLTDNGAFCLYGPFRREGAFNTQSNAGFHASLKRRDPDMGIRHLEELDTLAQTHAMRRERLYAMPANNHLAVWRRRAQ